MCVEEHIPRLGHFQAHPGFYFLLGPFSLSRFLCACAQPSASNMLSPPMAEVLTSTDSAAGLGIVHCYKMTKSPSASAARPHGLPTLGERAHQNWELRVGEMKAPPRKNSTNSHSSCPRLGSFLSVNASQTQGSEMVACATFVQL